MASKNAKRMNTVIAPITAPSEGLFSKRVANLSFSSRSSSVGAVKAVADGASDRSVIVHFLSLVAMYYIFSILSRKAADVAAAFLDS